MSRRSLRPRRVLLSSSAAIGSLAIAGIAGYAYVHGESPDCRRWGSGAERHGMGPHSAGRAGSSREQCRRPGAVAHTAATTTAAGALASSAVAAAGTSGVAGPAAATIACRDRLAATSGGGARRSDDPDGRARDGAGWRHDVAHGRRWPGPAVRGRPQ